MIAPRFTKISQKVWIFLFLSYGQFSVRINLFVRQYLLNTLAIFHVSPCPLSPYVYGYLFAQAGPVCVPPEDDDREPSW